MQLSFLNKNKKSNCYLGLLLKEDQGIALIISSHTNQTEIIDYEKFNYSNSWENIIDDIDEVLYRLESKHQITFEETIFFVYSHLLDEKTNQIKKTYQLKIKSIAKELELKPLGFIDCKEAVIRNLEKKDDNKLTAIVAELDKNDLSVFIYKAGQSAYAKSITRTNDIVNDLNLIFEEIRGKILLPTRIVLYNSKDLDYEVTKIVSYKWSTDLFIQLPRVEIVQEKDILHSLVSLFKQQIKVEQVEDIVSKQETASGFLIGQDIKDTDKEKIVEKKLTKTIDVKKWIDNLHFPKFKFSFIKPEWQQNFFIIIGLLIIFIGVIISEYSFHKIKINLFVPSDNLKKTLFVESGEDDNVDLSIKSIKKTWEISLSKIATGKKNIGDAATGEVTMYNFGKETVFSKGTRIETKGYSFSLNEEIKVASASLTTDGSAKLPGKAKVKITASEIGSESNLAKGQTFKIEELDPDVYFAKNETDFSGGSQKQITTVSEKDIENLETDIEKKAKDEKISNLNLSSSKRIVDQLTVTEIIKKDFSKEVGEEASNISLAAKVETTVYTYDKNDLVAYLYNKLKGEIKSGFVLDRNKISYQIKDAEKTKKNINLEISASGKTIKKVNKDQVVKRLIGKSENSIEMILKKDFEINGFEKLHKQPLALPFYKNLLPFFPKNYEVEISSL